jgi:threonine synthase
VAHGARIVQVEGNFDDCLELARKTAAEYPVAALVNSVNPTRIAGQASAAYEICDELGRAPDVHCLPVGNAGNITAYWTGYRAYAADGLVPATPRMFGFQAAGAAPLVHGHPVRNPETIATAIRIGDPASWASATAARDESDGRFAAVTDEEILAAYRLLSSREAVFVEPASAASVAGLLRSAADGVLPRGSLVVCTVTGHGLKDPDTALLAAAAPTVVPVDPGAVADALELR